MLRRLLFAINSPWLWPIVPLVAVAAVGEWAGATAAEAVAASCGAIATGIVIGMGVAGTRAFVHQARPPSADRQVQPTVAVGGTSGDDPAGQAPATESAGNEQAAPARIVDLRGARLVHTVLIRADLRRADLRGASLMGADLSGADLTDALLGPLEDGEPTSGSG